MPTRRRWIDIKGGGFRVEFHNHHPLPFTTSSDSPAFQQPKPAIKMQISLSTATALLLLPLGILASPAPVPVAEDVAVPDDLELEARDANPGELFKRNVLCKITGSSATVNCRSGPGTGYSVIATVKKGSYYSFGCYKTGTCVSGNW
jgi:hypothetical protein